jgi:hypothetical protein
MRVSGRSTPRQPGLTPRPIAGSAASRPPGQHRRGHKGNRHRRIMGSLLHSKGRPPPRACPMLPRTRDTLAVAAFPRDPSSVVGGSIVGGVPARLDYGFPKQGDSGGHDIGSPLSLLLPATEQHKTRQPTWAQPGSPFAPPATMATSWAAGIIAPEMTASYAFMCGCQLAVIIVIIRKARRRRGGRESRAAPSMRPS